jgi:serine/threonine-protein kinase HipA
MKRITVYADFDFLATPQEIGTLGYERVRASDFPQNT